MQKHLVIGLMSGSSLDGLDVCLVEFAVKNNSWKFEIKASEVYDYEEDFRQQLRILPEGTAYELAQMHTEFSRKQAFYLQDFFEKHPASQQAELIVSHGQTIFHQPEKSFTTQIGCGATLAALTHKKVVCDLRTYDLALGGQGAPLVPFGEKYLFEDYSSFVNIGGICNISIHASDTIEAYDVCPGNTLLNLLAQEMNLRYDDEGQIARSGQLHEELLHALSQVSFYKKSPPKTLGTEHILQNWLPIIQKYEIPTADKMHTVVEHIAQQIVKNLPSNQPILVTGGGAFNSYLMERMQHHSQAQVVVPAAEIVEFKEALIIAFVGLMRYLGQNNFLSSVTGADRDHMGGALYG